MLLSSNLRGDTSGEGEEAEGKSGDFHRCGMRKKGLAKSSVLCERGITMKVRGLSVSSQQVLRNRLITRLAKPPY